MCSKRIREARDSLGETCKKNKGRKQEEVGEASPYKAGQAAVKQGREGREIWWEESQMLEQF